MATSENAGSSVPARRARAARPKAAPARPQAKAARQRDPDATKARILEAAKREFARAGLGGARVDSIAARAKANKRMI